MSNIVENINTWIVENKQTLIIVGCALIILSAQQLIKVIFYSRKVKKEIYSHIVEITFSNGDKLEHLHKSNDVDLYYDVTFEDGHLSFFEGDDFFFVRSYKLISTTKEPNGKK